MHPIILYRLLTGSEYEQEYQIANKHFVTTKSRMTVHGGDLVIPRYSALPFYKELETDLKYSGAKLINTYAQHRYVADLINYSTDLEGLVPRVYTSLSDLPDTTGGPYVLKGETNSRKDRWLTHCFAQNKQEAIQVYMRLTEDTLFSDQHIYIREYVPLETYLIGLNGQPITREFRFFVCDKQVLCGGFYWSSHVDEIEKVPSSSEVPTEFLKRVIDIVGDSIRFYVIDVAKTKSGHFLVVELNDAAMSGLSLCSPQELYKNLKKTLWNFKVVT